MQSLQSSNSPSDADQKDGKPKRPPRLATGIVTWICRVVLGGVFVFSGFVKAVDPWGGMYKIADYFQAWHIGLPGDLALVQAALLATFEFCLGIMILTGSYRNMVRWLAAIFMGAMTLITLYILIVNPVEDCGCFGDAIRLTNPETFLKNVVLLVPAFILFRTNTRVRPLIRPTLQWLGLLLTFVYVALLQIIGYHIQPLIDFRPYPEGTSLSALAGADVDINFGFVYERDGVQHTFSADSLPGDDWAFVKRTSTGNNTDTDQPVIFDAYGDDVTADVFEAEGEQYLLIINDAQSHGLSRSEMASNLAAYADKHNAAMTALVALPHDSLDAWADRVDASYDVYSAEDTDLKMLARGEAALVILRDGVIRSKLNLYSLSPDFPTGAENPKSLVDDANESTLPRLTLLWLVLMAALVWLGGLTSTHRIMKQG